MAFIIPDKILDNLICNACNRYLSVKPVKVYPDKQVKCGRCTSKNDEGVVSIYGVLADHSLFKCTNRFDGCNKLLTYSEVRGHEETCKGKFVACPNCIYSRNFSTYAIPRHFKEHHPEEYLEKKWFIAKVDASLANTSTYYLYREGNLLFFISYGYNYCKNVLQLNIAYLGETEKAKQIKQRFTIFNNYKACFHSQLKPCTSYYSNTNLEYTFKISTNDLKLDTEYMVEFDLNLIHIAEMIPLLHLAPVHIPRKKLSLKRSYAEMQSEFQISSLGTSILKIKLNKIKHFIYPQCYNCGYLEWLEHYGKGAFMTIDYMSISYYYCFFCRHYFNTVEFTNVEKILPLETYQQLELHCKWENCDYVLGLPHIQKHEEICFRQSPRVCPVKSCVFFGKLFEIRKHFKKSHKAVFLQLLEPLITITDTSDTPQQSCVLVCDKFVWLKYFWNGSLLKMTMGMCDSDDDDIQPIAKIFDLNDTYLYCSNNSNVSFEFKLKMVVKIELKKLTR